METKIEKFRNEIGEIGLVGKSIKDLLEIKPALYYRIYNFSRKQKLWLVELMFDLGLTDLNRIDGVDSIERLDVLIEKLFFYKDGDWSKVSSSHKVLIKKFIKKLDLSFEIFLMRYNMTSEPSYFYNSISEIKEDLIVKGLLKNPSMIEIRTFDGGRVIANIESFASRNGLKMKDIWFALGISHNKALVPCETGYKLDFVYHNDDEVIQDFKSKHLIGKTKKEVKIYDNGKTVGRVSKYANRLGINIQIIWDILRIKSSSKNQYPSLSINELKRLVEEKGLIGKSIMQVNLLNPEISDQVKKIARKQKSMNKIWEDIGIVRTHGFSSVDEIVFKIKEEGYKTTKEVRSNWKFYKRIISYTNIKNISINEIWEKAGIPLPTEGRPSKGKEHA